MEYGATIKYVKLLAGRDWPKRKSVAIELHELAASCILNENAGAHAKAIFAVENDKVAIPKSGEAQNMAVSVQTLVSALYQTFSPKILVTMPQNSLPIKAGDQVAPAWGFYSVVGIETFVAHKKLENIEAKVKTLWEVRSNPWGYFLKVNELAEGFRPGFPWRYIGQEYEILKVDSNGNRELAVAVVDDTDQYMAEGMQWTVLKPRESMPPHRVLGWRLAGSNQGPFK